MYLNKSYYAPNEVADLLMVSPVTVRQWAQKGILKASMTAGGHRRFLREDIELFARARGLTLQPKNKPEKRILIVDDDEQFCRYLFELIKSVSEGVVLNVAHNGFDAGRQTMIFQPDLILLDLVMPDLDGFMVCQQIKKAHTTKNIRVLGMTGCLENNYESRILEAGAEMCLTKPIDNERLFEALGLGENHQQRSLT